VLPPRILRNGEIELGRTLGGDAVGLHLGKLIEKGACSCRAIACGSDESSGPLSRNVGKIAPYAPCAVTPSSGCRCYPHSEVADLKTGEVVPAAHKPNLGRE
jgi:hypothetical protein